MDSIFTKLALYGGKLSVLGLIMSFLSEVSLENETYEKLLAL